MGVFIKATFNKAKVHRVTDRYFPHVNSAMEYLEGWDVPKAEKGKDFEVKGVTFTLSHTMKEIRAAIKKGVNLEDNGYATAMKPLRGNGLHMPKNLPPRNPTEEAGKLDMPDKITMTPGKRDDAPKPELSINKTKSKQPMGAAISLKEICRELKIEPRAARVVLRKLHPGNEKQRWEWDRKDAEKIKAELKEHVK